MFIIQIIFSPPAATLIGTSPWELEEFFHGGVNSGFFSQFAKKIFTGVKSNEILFLLLETTETTIFAKL